ncbi:MAG: hypothetical protein IJA23_01220, partial [Clostridia bacterium]|nr:hypothetical protein [Clostridia bacterium]
MKKQQKKSMPNVMRKCAKFITMFVMMIVSVFFVACGKTGGAAASEIDAYGKYRLNPVTAVINYAKTSEGRYNEFTGSFIVPMEYYCEGLLKRQIDEAYEDREDADLTIDMVKSAFARDYDQVGKYAVPGRANGTTLATLNSTSGNMSIAYPDYSLWVDGCIYQIHVTVDLTKLQIYHEVAQTGGNGTAYDNKNYIAATDDLSNIFHFSYRIGTSGQWYDADEFVRAIYMENNNGQLDAVGGSVANQSNKSFDKMFYMCFQPILNNGGTSRRMRVKAVPNLGMNLDADATGANELTTQFVEYSEKEDEGVTRGDSLYSSVVKFNAYKMTFKTYSANSADLDYGYLSYNHKKFFFYETLTTLSRQTNKVNLSSITGFFSEGRVVNVNRHMETGGYLTAENGEVSPINFAAFDSIDDVP